MIGGRCRDLGAIYTRDGTEPVRSWQVLGQRVVESRFDALRGPAVSPLIGRDEEMDLLLRRWQRAKTGDGQVVLISGEAGLGKSCITAELGERLRPERCSGLSANSAGRLGSGPATSPRPAGEAGGLAGPRLTAR